MDECKPLQGGRAVRQPRGGGGGGHITPSRPTALLLFAAAQRSVQRRQILHGRAVQADRIKPTVKALGAQPFRPQCDELLSNCTFNFNLRRYNTEEADFGRAERGSVADSPQRRRVEHEERGAESPPVRRTQFRREHEVGFAATRRAAAQAGAYARSR